MLLYTLCRQIFVSTILLIGLVFWASIVAGIQALTSIKSLDVIFPGVATYAASHTFAGSLLTTYLPVIGRPSPILMILLMLCA